MNNYLIVFITFFFCGTYLVGKLIDNASLPPVTIVSAEGGVFIVKHDSKEVYFCYKGTSQDGEIYPICKSGARVLL